MQFSRSDGRPPNLERGRSESVGRLVSISGSEVEVILLWSPEVNREGDRQHLDAIFK